MSTAFETRYGTQQRPHHAPDHDSSVLDMETVASKLIDYLRDYLGCSKLRYKVKPELIPDGWDTYSFRFQLETGSCPVRDFQQQLAVKMFVNEHGLPRLENEFRAMEQVHHHGYPVPKPLLLESSDAIGGPFMIREFASGPTVHDYIMDGFWRMWQITGAMADTLAQLHRIPPAGFPHCERDMLTPSLEELEQQISDYGLQGLRNGVRWLQCHRPSWQERTTIVHLDYHPKNLIILPGQRLMVLDWSEAAVGDPHADLGRMHMLISCVSPEKLPMHVRAVAGIGRRIFCKRLLKMYRRHFPIRQENLDYYKAWAALRHLTLYGTWLHGSPEDTGGKEVPVDSLTNHIGAIEDYFANITHTRIQLD